MILKLGIDDRGLKIYKVSINDSPRLTLTYFMAMSNLVKIAYCADISRAFTGPFVFWFRGRGIFICHNYNNYNDVQVNMHAMSFLVGK